MPGERDDARHDHQGQLEPLIRLRSLTRPARPSGLTNLFARPAS